MAQNITVALEDDLDGGPADETVRFAIGGTEYEIDLSKKNARALRRRLAPFVDHARKAGPEHQLRPALGPPTGRRRAACTDLPKSSAYPAAHNNAGQRIDLHVC